MTDFTPLEEALRQLHGGVLGRGFSLCPYEWGFIFRKRSLNLDSREPIRWTRKNLNNRSLYYG